MSCIQIWPVCVVEKLEWLRMGTSNPALRNYELSVTELWTPTCGCPVLCGHEGSVSVPVVMDPTVGRWGAACFQEGSAPPALCVHTFLLVALSATGKFN